MLAIFWLSMVGTTVKAMHLHHARHAHVSSSSSTPYKLKPAYRLVDDYKASPEHFFSPNTFDFQTFADPTHGAVNYLDRTTAIRRQLLQFVTTETQHANDSESNAPVYIGVDASPNAHGSRGALRLQSRRSYNAGTLIVADIAHMPSGCGTWPALWMLNADETWPAGGEWDIVENVNSAAQVAVTLHTTPGCSISRSNSGEKSTFSGKIQTANCDVSAMDQPRNAGCSVLAPAGTKSFGDDFNANGGGTFAAEWRDDGFAVWFFPRALAPEDPVLSLNMSTPASEAVSYPQSLLTSSPDPSTFGQPIAEFHGPTCNWPAHFKNMRLVINTSLCGDWAGSPQAWSESGCAASTGFATCAGWVASSTATFDEAYWQLNRLHVYEQQQ